MNEPTFHMLIVEDDPDVGMGLKDFFELKGYDVNLANDGEKAVNMLGENGKYDIVLLDVMLPKKSGYDVLRESQEMGVAAPVLMLTAKGEQEDVLRGFGLGVDDYVTKPFALAELMARITAVLRRTRDISSPAPEAVPPKSVTIFADVEVHRNRRTVLRGGTELQLTHLEFELLCFFLDNPDKVLERDLLLRHVWGTSGSKRTVDNFVAQLRSKLEDNPDSPRQLAEVLFERLGLPVIRRTKTGPSTDAAVLEVLAAQGHELPRLILQYRELQKLKSTYVDVLPRSINRSTGRIHTSFNQVGAQTGRLSSSDPNLQNIPIRTERGEAIRRGFIPSPGSLFVVADYSQIELRLMAHLSGDPAFVQAFREGGDIHRQTAAIIFGVELADVTAEMRARAKTINFGTIYGQGPFALSNQLGIPQDEAKAFITDYFTRFGGVRAFLDSAVEHAREHGYVETLFGRRRYIPEIHDRNFNLRSFAERTAANTPLQGSAADLIKRAMTAIHAALPAAGLKARMLLQVHDELVIEAPESEAESAAAVVKQHMEAAAELSVPLAVDVGIGRNWIDAKRG